MSASDSESRLGGGFVEYQDARIGQDGAGDGNALLLSAGKLHAAFADDGAVFFVERFREFIHASNAAGGEDLFLGALGRAYATFSRIEPSKRKRLLQDHAQLRAIGAEASAEDRCHPPGCGPRRACKNAEINPMMVDLPEPEGPTSAVTVPGSATKRNACSTSLPGS